MNSSRAQELAAVMKKVRRAAAMLQGMGENAGAVEEAVKEENAGAGKERGTLNEDS